MTCFALLLCADRGIIMELLLAHGQHVVCIDMSACACSRLLTLDALK